MRFPHGLNPEPSMTDDTPPFSEAQASVLIGTAEKMVEIWTRLPAEKQAALLARFGSEENAIAALVTTRLVSGENGN
ncbi:hypothetical protein [Pseudomonas kilonensis]|uniref:Uncharacterized protein n=1 Tax=Pseudomonas kilonensis TaxID=132476 RepID=A0ABY0YKN6_9PSED|nr:hypothetical protein [Pseudomonas kilonensis]SED67114.1 hypothetical protein SAMN04490188_1086 [Pseudomonas kilonensis]